MGRMIIGGLQKTSLIDYPGRLSCVVFLKGCNFDCPYCHNPGLVHGEPCGQALDEGSVVDFLAQRRPFLDSVVVSGGEPTLQPELLSFCRKVKRLGYSIKLDTNGSRPGALKELLEEGVVDYVAMDIKTDPLEYGRFIRGAFNPEDVLSSIAILLQSKGEYEFRTTCVKPLVDGRIVKGITRIIEGAKRYALQHFHDAELLHPEFFQGTNPAFEEDEILHLKETARPWVEECIVR